MTSRGDSTDEERSDTNHPGRVLVVVVLTLALAATAVLVLTDSAQWLRLGVVAALWAALVGAFLAAKYRKQVVDKDDEFSDLQAVYELELEREVAARREYELEIENETRQRLSEESKDDLESLRNELRALRENLEALLGGEVLVERVALHAESTRMRSLAEQPRMLPTSSERLRGLTTGKDQQGGRTSVHTEISRSEPVRRSPVIVVPAESTPGHQPPRQGPRQSGQPPRQPDRNRPPQRPAGQRPVEPERSVERSAERSLGKGIDLGWTPSWEPDGNPGKRPEPRTDQTGTGYRPESRTEQTGTGYRPAESRAEQTGTGRRPESRAEQTGTGYRPESRADQTGTGRRPESRADQTGTGYRPESRTEQTGTGYRPQGQPDPGRRLRPEEPTATAWNQQPVGGPPATSRQQPVDRPPQRASVDGPTSTNLPTARKDNNGPAWPDSGDRRQVSMPGMPPVRPATRNDLRPPSRNNLPPVRPPATPARTDLPAGPLSRTDLAPVVPSRPPVNEQGPRPARHGGQPASEAPRHDPPTGHHPPVANEDADGAHAAGRSVTELLAALGSEDTPRRHRRRAD